MINYYKLFTQNNEFKGLEKKTILTIAMLKALKLFKGILPFERILKNL